MLFTRSARSLSPDLLTSPSFLAFFFFLQNFLFLFFLCSGAGVVVDAGADVDASSLPRAPPPHTEDEQQDAQAPRRSLLPPSLHLFAADENRPIAGSTREWGGTLGPIRAGATARICWQYFYRGEGRNSWTGLVQLPCFSWTLARAKFGKALFCSSY